MFHRIPSTTSFFHLQQINPNNLRVPTQFSAPEKNIHNVPIGSSVTAVPGRVKEALREGVSRTYDPNMTHASGEAVIYKTFSLANATGRSDLTVRVDIVAADNNRPPYIGRCVVKAPDGTFTANFNPPAHVPNLLSRTPFPSPASARQVHNLMQRQHSIIRQGGNTAELNMLVAPPFLQDAHLHMFLHDKKHLWNSDSWVFVDCKEALISFDNAALHNGLEKIDSKKQDKTYNSVVRALQYLSHKRLENNSSMFKVTKRYPNGSLDLWFQYSDNSRTKKNATLHLSPLGDKDSQCLEVIRFTLREHGSNRLVYQMETDSPYIIPPEAETSSSTDSFNAAIREMHSSSSTSTGTSSRKKTGRDKLVETLKTALEKRGLGEGTEVVKDAVKKLLKRSLSSTKLSEFNVLTLEQARDILKVSYKLSPTNTRLLDRILKSVLPAEQKKEFVSELLDKPLDRTIPAQPTLSNLQPNWEESLLNTPTSDLLQFKTMMEMYGTDITSRTERQILSRYAVDELDNALNGSGNEPEAFRLLGRIWYRRLKLHPQAENEGFSEHVVKPFYTLMNEVLKDFGIRVGSPHYADPVVYVRQGNKGYAYTELADYAKQQADGGKEAAQEVLDCLRQYKSLGDLSLPMRALVVITQFAETARGFDPDFADNCNVEVFMEDIVAAENPEEVREKWDAFVKGYKPAPKFETDSSGSTSFPAPKTKKGQELYERILQIPSQPTQSSDSALQDLFSEMTSHISEEEVRDLLNDLGADENAGNEMEID